MNRRHHIALPAGYRLHWYEIRSVLGQGGFGITYLAQDLNLNQQVAIKEFLPTSLATRSVDSTVHPLTDDHSDTYGWGLTRFIEEARTLATLRDASVVAVFSVFEENNTAYMVMGYEDGQSLGAVLKGSGRLQEAAVRQLLRPLLAGLERVHDAGFVHRDIKPDNIYIRADGSPVLLDFGSARQALGVETQTLTALVTPGYAPFEQYNSSPDDRQGPWTDIYALGAMLYRAVTGAVPPDAMARASALFDGKDTFVPASACAGGEYSPELLNAIDCALAFKAKDRPQSIAAWRTLFDAPHGAPRAAGAAAETLDSLVGADDLTVPRADLEAPTRISDTAQTLEASARQASRATAPPVPEPARKARTSWWLAAGAVACAALAVFAFAPWQTSDEQGDEASTAGPVSPVPASPVALAPQSTPTPTPPATPPARSPESSLPSSAPSAAAPAPRPDPPSDATDAPRLAAVPAAGDDVPTPAPPAAPPAALPVTRAPTPAPSVPVPEPVGLAALPAGFDQVLGPSFDCATPRLNTIERLLCEDRRLARADGVMGALYRKVREAVPAARRAAIKTGQRQWLTQRNAECFDGKRAASAEERRALADCLLRATVARARTLHAMLGN